MDVALGDARERALVGPVRADRVLGGDDAVERVEHQVLVEEGHPGHQRLHQRGLAQAGHAHHGYVVVLLLVDVVEDGIPSLQVLPEECSRRVDDIKAAEGEEVQSARCGDEEPPPGRVLRTYTREEGFLEV